MGEHFNWVLNGDTWEYRGEEAGAGDVSAVVCPDGRTSRMWWFFQVRRGDRWFRGGKPSVEEAIDEAVFFLDYSRGPLRPKR